jgi:hypothetical protein
VNVIVHEHDERLRGTPLVLATNRLFTDEGRFWGSGEQYGARAAFDEAAAVVEQNVLQDRRRPSTAAPTPRGDGAAARLVGRERRRADGGRWQQDRQ